MPQPTQQQYRKAQGLDPICSQDSKILILGTIPSQSSQNAKQYYDNPSNRFWEVICKWAGVSTVPSNYNDKVKLLTNNNIALWDLFKSCDIRLKEPYYYKCRT